MIDDLTAKCPTKDCSLPAKPSQQCPYCQLSALSSPGPTIRWERLKGLESLGEESSYTFEGPFSIFLGRWQNNDEQKGMWHVRVENERFFLPADMPVEKALVALEEVIWSMATKVVVAIQYLHEQGRHLEVVDEPDSAMDSWGL